MMKMVSVILLSPLFLTACVTTGPAVLYGDGDNMKLTLINEDSSFNDLTAPDLGLIDPKGWNSEKENKAASLCGLDAGKKPRTLAMTAAALLIEPAVRLFVDHIERAIRNEIEA